jgi:hypothetical protein
MVLVGLVVLLLPCFNPHLQAISCPHLHLLRGCSAVCPAHIQTRVGRLASAELGTTSARCTVVEFCPTLPAAHILARFTMKEFRATVDARLESNATSPSTARTAATF